MKVKKYQEPSGPLTVDLSKAPMTRDQYLDLQRNTIINAALQKSLSRTEPSQPIIKKLAQTEPQ